jgi:hypothetical protein
LPARGNRIEITEGNLVETFRGHCINKRNPMMIMVHRNKKFLEKIFLKSFTKNMACTPRLPLLVVPEEE